MSISSRTEIKQEVREFYDHVGWQLLEDGFYQNASYEDLRPVSRTYIHDCHLRVARHLQPAGTYLLDAGSGPIQYPEYLEYSKGYQRRVCADISITALQEARKRVGDHGLFVVADIAKLPFKPDAFDGVVSLHTIHHLPQEEHISAYRQLHRVLKPGKSAVVVNGWNRPPLLRVLNIPIQLRDRLRAKLKRMKSPAQPGKAAGETTPTGTFVRKYNAAWLKEQLAPHMDIEILVWRGVSVKVLRFYIHKYLLGWVWLKLFYGLEELFPRYFGENGSYPLLVIKK